MDYIEYRKHKNMSNIMKIILIIIVILIIYIMFKEKKPIYTTNTYEDLTVVSEPVQKKISSNDVISFQIDQYKYVLYPRYTYKMNVKIKGVSTSNYSDPIWRKKLSKYDIAVVWGKLAEEQHDKYITYSQMNRYLSYRYKSEIGLDKRYILSHLSNNHIIANENITKAISILKVDDICYFEGKLVDCHIYENEKLIDKLNTSTVRTDTGNGSCEIIYLEKIIIGDKVFE